MGTHALYAYEAAAGVRFSTDVTATEDIDLLFDARASLVFQTDLDAVQIEGLVWNENAPAFGAVTIDQRGFPLRIVAPDPRAFAVHKFWLSRRLDRDPVKKTRDAAQAKAVAALVARSLPHLPFRPEDLRSFPNTVVEEAAMLFTGLSGPAERFEW